MPRYLGGLNYFEKASENLREVRVEKLLQHLKNVESKDSKQLNEDSNKETLVKSQHVVEDVLENGTLETNCLDLSMFDEVCNVAWHIDEIAASAVVPVLCDGRDEIIPFENVTSDMDTGIIITKETSEEELRQNSSAASEFVNSIENSFSNQMDKVDNLLLQSTSLTANDSNNETDGHDIQLLHTQHEYQVKIESTELTETHFNTSSHHDEYSSHPNSENMCQLSNECIRSPSASYATSNESSDGVVYDLLKSLCDTVVEEQENTMEVSNTVDQKQENFSSCEYNDDCTSIKLEYLADNEDEWEEDSFQNLNFMNDVKNSQLVTFDDNSPLKSRDEMIATMQLDEKPSNEVVSTSGRNFTQDCYENNTNDIVENLMAENVEIKVEVCKDKDLNETIANSVCEDVLSFESDWSDNFPDEYSDFQSSLCYKQQTKVVTSTLIKSGYVETLSDIETRPKQKLIETAAIDPLEEFILLRSRNTHLKTLYDSINEEIRIKEELESNFSFITEPLTPVLSIPLAVETKQQPDEVVKSNRPTKEKSSFESVRLICSTKLSQYTKLMKLMETSYNISFLERNYEVVGVLEDESELKLFFADMVVDERTGILLRPLEDIGDTDKVKELINMIVMFGLKYETFFVILHDSTSMGLFSSLSMNQMDANWSENLSRLSVASSFFSSKKQGYEVQLLFAVGDRDLAQMVRKICDLSLSLTTVWAKDQWIERSWILDGMSAQERFLLLFPCINSFSAQVMLATHPLKVLLSLSLDELVKTVPWIPATCLKAFHAICHRRSIVHCLQTSSSLESKFNNSEPREQFEFKPLSDFKTLTCSVKDYPMEETFCKDNSQDHEVDNSFQWSSSSFASPQGESLRSPCSSAATTWNPTQVEPYPLFYPVTVHSTWTQPTLFSALPCYGSHEVESCDRRRTCNPARFSSNLMNCRSETVPSVYMSSYDVLPLASSAFIANSHYDCPSMFSTSEMPILCQRHKKKVVNQLPMQLPNNVTSKEPAYVCQKNVVGNVESNEDWKPLKAKARSLRYQRIPGNKGQTRLSFC